MSARHRETAQSSEKTSLPNGTTKHASLSSKRETTRSFNTNDMATPPVQIKFIYVHVLDSPDGECLFIHGSNVAVQELKEMRKEMRAQLSMLEKILAVKTLAPLVALQYEELKQRIKLNKLVVREFGASMKGSGDVAFDSSCCNNPDCKKGLGETLCGKSKDFRVCPNCQEAYCSQECYNTHWAKGHKKECGEIRPTSCICTHEKHLIQAFMYLAKRESVVELSWNEYKFRFLADNPHFDTIFKQGWGTRIKST